MSDSFNVFAVALTVAVLVGIGWIAFEVWIFTSATYLGHVIEGRRSRNVQQQDGMTRNVRVKGWVEGKRFDTWVPSFTKPPEAGTIRVHGRLVAGRPHVRTAVFPFRLTVSVWVTVLLMALLVLVVTS